MSHAATFFTEAGEICRTLDAEAIDTMAVELADLRERGGRLFFWVLAVALPIVPTLLMTSGSFAGLRLMHPLTMSPNSQHERMTRAGIQFSQDGSVPVACQSGMQILSFP